MTRYVALLRGVNVGAHNRIRMPVLTEVAAGLGYGDPQTYLQSGNLALTSAKGEAAVVRELAAAIETATGLAVPVVLRSHDELVAAVAANPLHTPEGDAQKLFFVTFYPATVSDLGVDCGAYGDEQVARAGREVYAWHPNGMHSSRLASALARNGPAGGTARNWRTVLALVELTA